MRRKIVMASVHMPVGWWTDPKVIEEGAKMYSGEANTLINAAVTTARTVDR